MSDDDKGEGPGEAGTPSEKPGDPSLNGDIHGTPDATLGGYFREHSRPPAFEGADGEPYTVSIEVEKTGDLLAPYQGYLVFPRWASTGLGVVGHVETPTLLSGRNQDEVQGRLGDLPLVQVKYLLDQAIRRSEPAEGEEREREEDAPNDHPEDSSPGS
jgi:hypothetical protein